MEIFGIGPAELFLILLIAFIVLGPERLPSVARMLGKWIRQLRHLSNDLTDQLRAELTDTTRELQTAQEELRHLPTEFASQLRTELADITRDLQTIHQDVSEAGQTLVNSHSNDPLTIGNRHPTTNGPIPAASRQQVEAEAVPPKTED